MERKLELRDVVGYLPYGKVYFFIEEENDFYVIEKCMCYAQDAINEGAKPVLRPLDDLYRTITHNGEQVTPILELARMQSSNKSATWVLGGNEHRKFAECNNGYVFDYNSKKNCFCLWNTLNAPVSVLNQYQLFDYMCECKLDFRNLIKDKLAISVYDLDTNPYK